MKVIALLAALVSASLPGVPESTGPGATSYRRADFRKTANGHGKCVVEIEVDRAADVEIRGDTARLRTIGGQAATWRRFECNAPLPQNPGSFRFRGVDGRGEQQLLREPWGGRGAVILIDDPKDGREGYTFSIEWGGLEWGAGRQRT